MSASYVSRVHLFTELQCWFCDGRNSPRLQPNPPLVAIYFYPQLSSASKTQDGGYQGILRARSLKDAPALQAVESHIEFPIQSVIF